MENNPDASAAEDQPISCGIARPAMNMEPNRDHSPFEWRTQLFSGTLFPPFFGGCPTKNGLPQKGLPCLPGSLNNWENGPIQAPNVERFHFNREGRLGPVGPLGFGIQLKKSAPVVPFALCLMGVAIKIKQEGQAAGFGPCFHLPGQAILEFRFFEPQPHRDTNLVFVLLGNDVTRGHCLSTEKSLLMSQVPPGRTSLALLFFFVYGVGLLKRSPCCNHLKHEPFFPGKIQGHHHLQVAMFRCII